MDVKERRLDTSFFGQAKKKYLAIKVKSKFEKNCKV